ncbi:unnamed protein product [Orchesella dallaii]|uniref:Protein sleepless n=1 Tax=Orchesella dallaii TaxID=48710 RepID=A0ABP1RQ35_9HEXA
MNLLRKLFFIFLVGVPITQASKYECYTCQHRKPDVEGVKSPSSCETGKKPKSNLKDDCESTLYEYYSFGSGNYLGVPKDMLLSNTGLRPQSTIPKQARNNEDFYTCFKLTVSGKAQGTNDDLAYTFRGCLNIILVNGTYPDICYEGVRSKLANEIKEIELKDLAENGATRFGGDPNIGICSCNGNNCNSAKISATLSFILPLVAVAIQILHYIK